MGEGTTLGDLLELQLHRVEDEVKNIVDKAVKEMAIEKVRLESIRVVLSVVEVAYETCQNHDLRLIVVCSENCCIFPFSVISTVIHVFVNSSILTVTKCFLYAGFGRDNPDLECYVTVLREPQLHWNPSAES